jgi:glycosyltransferase involved in cell wall biosynthesis
VSETLPLVTVVTPSFNQAPFLEATMRSVLDQDYPNVEYIVVDGGSTDGSVEIIRRYADRLAYWVSERDRGQSDALNKGFARSHGEIMAWLCSDDLYVPGAIRRAVEVFGQHPRAAVVYGTGDYIDREGSFVRPLPARPFNRADTLRGHPWLAQPAAFWRRFAWNACGPLRHDYHYCMDMELWLSMAERFDFVYVPEKWALYRLHGDSKTVQGWGPFEKEAVRIRREHQDRVRLLRRAVERPAIFLTPSMLLFLAARLMPRSLMRSINRARGLTPVQE